MTFVEKRVSSSTLLVVHVGFGNLGRIGLRVYLDSSGLGALKAEHIDTWSTNAEVQKFLDDTLYKDLVPNTDSITQDLLGNIFEPCLPTMCKQYATSLWNETSAFVRCLQKHLDEKKIMTGSLLILKSSEFPKTTSFFLGVILKRPLLQTAILAKVNDDRVLFEKKDDGQPKISTTHHLFSEFLRSTSAQLTEIAVEHWDCSHSLDDASRLLVVAEELSSDFLVSTTPQKGTGARKPPVPMPFGLSARSRPQKSQKRKQPKAFGACTRERKKARACESSDSDEEKRQAETSSSEGLPDTPNEEENMVPISQAAQNELVEVRRVESENVKLDEVKESLLEGDKEIQATQGGSFFSKKLGLADAGLAATSRSKCRSCGQFIAKGTVRFEWYWNKMRPNSWIHAHCVLNMAGNFDMKEDTKQVLKSILDKSTSSTDADNPVRVEAARILSGMA